MSYHHGNLREALVETAADLARARGVQGVVLREVARRAGVSHNAAYRHFADKEALLAEVAWVGMSRLEAAMQTELDQVDVPGAADRARARLAATGRGYVRFALAEPGFFEVAFATPLERDLEGDSGGPYGLVNAALDELVEAGVLSARRRPGTEVTCWAAVHGFAVLHLSGPLREAPAEERDAALEQLLGLVQRAVTG